MILSAQTILDRHQRKPLIIPFALRTVHNGMTFGLGPAGYDIRSATSVMIHPGSFALITVMEHIDLPTDLLGSIRDKSSWGRKGLAVQNTVIEPGWRGFLTLELSNHNGIHSHHTVKNASIIQINQGDPIAQIIFELLDQPTTLPYKGKYQDQPQAPIGALEEREQKQNKE